MPELALDHDFEELFGGDMYALLKQAIEAIEPGVYEQAVDSLTDTISPAAKSVLHQIEAKNRAAAGTVVKFCVKLADLLESLMYLNDYGTGPRKAWAIDQISGRLRGYVAAYMMKEPRLKWSAVQQILHGMCPEQFSVPVDYHSPYPREGED